MRRKSGEYDVAAKKLLLSNGSVLVSKNVTKTTMPWGIYSSLHTVSILKIPPAAYHCQKKTSYMYLILRNILMFPQKKNNVPNSMRSNDNKECFEKILINK